MSKGYTIKPLSLAELTALQYSQQREEELAKQKANSLESQKKDVSTNHSGPAEVSSNGLIQEASPNPALDTPTKSDSISSSTNDPIAADLSADDPFDQPEGGWERYEFPDSISLLNFYSPQILKGTVTPHLWQIEVSEDLCAKGYTDKKPLKYCLCANNGSGKDSFILAPYAVWFIMCQIRARVVITTSSGTQLTNQTEPYIADLCRAINEKHGEQIFKIRQRYIRCLKSGSEIRMFATDDPGKAEGYHPLEPNRPFLKLVNECKSVDEEIFKAINRCTGFSHYLLVSSPGEAKGSFHHAWKMGQEGKAGWKSRTVTVYDCPHSNIDEMESDRFEYGDNSAYFRSKWLALFTSIDSMVVINQEIVIKCLDFCKIHLYRNWPTRVGMDLAAGGDECVVSIWQGNKRIAQLAWRERDTTISAIKIDHFLRQEQISKDSEYVRADDGGVGRGIIDQLVRMGWLKIKRVMNQSPARDKKAYGNKGAEMCFRFKRLIEEGLLMLPTEDEIFMHQLTSRHYKQSEGSNNRLFLVSKPDEKAEGFKSPDRLDAAMLALEDLRVNDFLETELDASGNIIGLNKPKTISHGAASLLTIEQVKEEQENRKYADAEKAKPMHSRVNAYAMTGVYHEDPAMAALNQPKGAKIAKRVYGSLLAILRQQ